MKRILFLVLLNAFILKAYSQNRDSVFVVFFAGGFKNDSVRVLLNEKVIMDATLYRDPSKDQTSGFAFTGFMKSDSLQCLTFIELPSNSKFKTIVKKDSDYLYVYKLGKDSYRFDYSNKLSLPE